MSFIENRNINKNGKENKDEAGGLAVLPHSTPYNFQLSPIT